MKKNNLYSKEKKVLELKKLDNSYNESGRTYYESKQGNIYMSVETKPKFENFPENIRKSNLIFYSANNSEGEPEYAIKKDTKIKIGNKIY